MFIPETSPNEILRIVSKLKNKYSSGLDEFPDCFLKLMHLPLYIR